MSIPTVEHALHPKLLEYARSLRKSQTNAEALLWQLLRNRGLNNWKFRRQHPLSKGFILDFYCVETKVAIEIDGGYHNSTSQKEYDDGRTYEISQYGINVIRFTNDEVLNQTEKVLMETLRFSLYKINNPATTPSPSGEGRGEDSNTQQPPLST